MKSLAIIPARYGSTRFPGKPLEMIGGMSMVMRVYNQVKKAKNLSDVIIATDDERIADHVITHHGKVMMTSTLHTSGTDRCGEVIEKLHENFDVVINVQGDEPFIQPEQIELILTAFADETTNIATLAFEIQNQEEVWNPNTVKVVRDKKMNALYFSRSPIPFIRNSEKSNWPDAFHYLKHIGIYAYRKEVLIKIVQLKPTALELAEALEQLRWLENGISIRVLTTTHESKGIDTPEDLEWAKTMF